MDCVAPCGAESLYAQPSVVAMRGLRHGRQRRLRWMETTVQCRKWKCKKRQSRCRCGFRSGFRRKILIEEVKQMSCKLPCAAPTVHQDVAGGGCFPPASEVQRNSSVSCRHNIYNPWILHPATPRRFEFTLIGSECLNHLMLIGVYRYVYMSADRQSKPHSKIEWLPAPKILPASPSISLPPLFRSLNENDHSSSSFQNRVLKSE